MSDGSGGPRGLDMSQDPDRYDPAKDLDADVPRGGVPHSDAGPGDRTLPELLGDGAQEDDRTGLEWIVGLLAVFAFLALVTVAFSHWFSPG